MNEEAKETLRQLALEAAQRASGSVDAAQRTLNSLILERNDLILERELCAAYRSTALQVLVSAAFAELRTPSHHEPPDPPTQKHATGQPRTDFPPTPGRLSYLDIFFVGGKPIGDCTPEEMEPAAVAHERDAKFIRLMMSGLPAYSRLRDHVTPAEADQAFAMARGDSVIVERIEPLQVSTPPTPAEENEPEAELLDEKKPRRGRHRERDPP